MRQAKKHIHNAQLYTLYNIGVDAIVTGCGSLQKKIEKKLRKYLVVPNIYVLSLSLSLSLDRPGVTTFFNYFVRAREAWRATHSEQRTHRSFLCSSLYSIVCHAQSDISPVLSHKNIINIYGVNLAV